ncbi:MAG: hypothetical protein Fur006_12420 [Coleofasciculaceae cyanobacterium]
MFRNPHQVNSPGNVRRLTNQPLIGTPDVGWACLSQRFSKIFLTHMASKDIKIKFPVWQYLNQPVFSSKTKLILDPRLFAYLYRVKLLERCWYKHCDSPGRHCN